MNISLSNIIRNKVLKGIAQRWYLINHTPFNDNSYGYEWLDKMPDFEASIIAGVDFSIDIGEGEANNVLCAIDRSLRFLDSLHNLDDYSLRFTTYTLEEKEETVRFILEVIEINE